MKAINAEDGGQWSAGIGSARIGSARIANLQRSKAKVTWRAGLQAGRDEIVITTLHRGGPTRSARRPTLQD